MTIESPALPPIACTLPSPAFKARLDWIGQLNAAAPRDHYRHGLRLELSYTPEAVEKVREMVRREQRCCAFLSFEIHEERDLVRVIIQVPEAGREVANMVFECFLAKASSKAGCASSVAPESETT